ncbi:MAG: sensor domain-containing diguanylate cyclase, partial [Microcystaceae cyanobacterium]
KAEILEILKTLNKTKQPLSHVNYWQTKEREKRLISWKNTPILDEKGRVSYFIKNGIDITEKVFIEKALLESQAQFKTMFEKANIGMALLDFNSNIITSNKQLQYILYYSECQLVEKPFIDLIYHQEMGDFITFYQGFIDGDRDYFQMEATCLSQDKQIIWVQLVVSAVRTDEDQFKFAVAMIEDISLRKEAEKAKAELTTRNQSLVAALGEIVYRHDFISDFIEWEGNYSQILGYSLQELGQNSEFWLQHIHPDDYPLVLAEMEQAIAENRLLDIDYRFQHQDGSYHWFHDRGVLTIEEEQIQTIVGVMLDITERKILEEQRLNAEKKYKQLLETTTEGVWIIDSFGKTTFVNQMMADMLGYGISEMLEKTIFDCMTLEDAAIAQENLERRRQGISENHEFRFICKDGAEIWTLIATSPIKNEENEVVGALGMISDITEQKRLEFALKTSNRKLNETIQQLEAYNQDMALMNELNDFLQACKTVQEAYQILAQSLQSLFPNCSGNLFRINVGSQSVEMVINWGKSHTKSDFNVSECWGLRRGSPHYLSSDNPRVHCCHLLATSDLIESVCIPLITEGREQGLLFIGTETTEGLTLAKQQLARTLAESIALILGNLELREILEFQSIHDPLTGLYNRNYWEQALEREIKLAERRESSISVIMVDVDHFKRFNDTFSHQVGDLVLKQMSQILSGYCRSTDIVCRYGGEEFLLIMPDASLEDAYKRAEELRLAVRNLQLYSGEKDLGQLTASFGVAAYPESVNSGYDLTIMADQALLQAKQAGRDRVIIYQFSLELPTEIDS